MPNGLNAIVDLSHHNGDPNFADLRAAGVLGVIHKATQGINGPDPTYAKHKQWAQAAGLLWGAYHFGTGEDGVAQADSFLRVVGDSTGQVLVLDFEPNTTGPSMSLEEARAFVTHVKDQTGRYPGIYSGHYIKELLGTGSDPVPPNWSDWTLWQYTDGALGPDPKEIPGVGRFDRDLYNGGAADLQAFWGT